MGASLLEPITAPTAQTLKRSLTGKTKIGRLQDIGLIAQGMPDWIFDNEQIEKEYVDDHVVEMAVLAKAHPPWLGGRLMPRLGPLGKERQDDLKGMGGGDFTHEALVFPTATSLDVMNFHAGLLMGLYAFGAAVTEGQTGEPSQVAENVESHAWEAILSQFIRPVEFGARSGLTSLGADLEYTQKGDRRWLTPAEAMAMKGILPGSPKWDPVAERYYTSPLDYLAWRTVPIFATSVPYHLKSLIQATPEWKRSWQEGIGAYAQQLLRLPQRVPYNPRREVESRVKDINRRYHQRPEKDADEPSAEAIRNANESGALPDTSFQGD